MSGMSEISHLPINAETCLALNRTYQELILESLKKIELALNENREKQVSQKMLMLKRDSL